MNFKLSKRQFLHKIVELIYTKVVFFRFPLFWIEFLFPTWGVLHVFFFFGVYFSFSFVTSAFIIDFIQKGGQKYFLVIFRLFRSEMCFYGSERLHTKNFSEIPIGKKLGKNSEIFNFCMGKIAKIGMPTKF